MGIRSRARAGRGLAVLAAALVVALTVPAAAPAAGTLVHAYHGDGDAKDAVLGADASDGVLMGATTFGTGHLGQAFAFAGNGDYVRIPSNPSFYPSGSFTVDGWLSTSTPVPGGGHQQATLAGLNECQNLCPADANSGWHLLIYEGRAYGFVRDTDASGPVGEGGGEVLWAGPLLNDGVLHHLTLVRDMGAQVLALYADGIEVAERALNAGADGALTDVDGENDPVTLGATLTGAIVVGAEPGAVDEVRYLSGADYPDTTPPVITPLVTGTTGNDGWITSAGAVSWTIEDESIARTRTGCDQAAIADGVATLTCQVTSAGGSSSRSVDVKRDATAPAVACQGAPTLAVGASGFVTATVSDGGSGPALATVTAAADTHSAASRSAAVTGRDIAGNATTVQCPYTVQAPAPKPKTTPVAISKLAELPPARACVSRRRFRIRLRSVKATRIVAAQIRLNAKAVRTVRGKALGLPIDLTGLPKGTFKVTITVTDAKGAKRVGTRTYHTCVPKRRA